MVNQEPATREVCVCVHACIVCVCMHEWCVAMCSPMNGMGLCVFMWLHAVVWVTAVNAVSRSHC